MLNLGRYDNISDLALYTWVGQYARDESGPWVQSDLKDPVH
jgi:hypothetical protein